MLRTKIAPSVNGVASGKTATVNFEVGKRYHSVTLAYGYDGSNASKETRGTSANQILGDIRVKLNGKTQRTFTAKQLNLFNSLNSDPLTGKIVELVDAFGTADGTVADVTGSFVQGTLNDNFQEESAKITALIRALTFSQFGLRTAGTMGSSGYREYLTIYFSEPWRKGVNAQQASAWNLDPGDVSTFQIEVDFQTITTPALDVVYNADPLVSGGIGAIEKVTRQTITVSGTSKDIGDIQIPKTDVLRALLLFAVSDGHYVNKAKLTINGEDVHDPLDYLQKRAVLSGWLMNPDLYTNSTTEFLSPAYAVPLDFDDPLTSAVPGKAITGMNLHVDFDASASGTMDVLVTRDGPPD